MSMSTHVYGIRDDNEQHRKYVKAVLALQGAGIERLPTELTGYFGTNYTENVDFDEPLKIDLRGEEAVPFSTDSTTGFDVILSKLEPGITRIRFENRW